VSDAPDRKGQSNETFRSKDKLKLAGFKWDSGVNSWTIAQSQLQKAQEILSAINKKPIEKFIDRIEEIPEFLNDTDNLSKKDELGQQIDQYVSELSIAVDTAAQSAKIKDFLEFYAKFHNYSFYNTFLIYIQRKDATKVAGYRKWEEVHRRVKKGAKGITILAPIKSKEEAPTGTAPIAGSPAEPAKKGFVRFMAVTVFDVSDTEAINEKGEIPEKPEWFGKNTASELADEISLCCQTLAEEMGIKVTTSDARGGEKGYSAGGHINLSSDVEGVYKASVIVHEIAHELLHSRGQFKSYIGDEDEDERLSSEIKELQAESVAYVVMKYYDLPVEHHATYLAMWRANKDSVKRNLDIIKKAADFIIKKINDIRKELSNSA
jgi:hypothetical protein